MNKRKLPKNSDISALKIETAHSRDCCPQLESSLKDKFSVLRNNTILFISHEASRTGAPIALLKIIRWLRPRIPNKFRIILRSEGPMESEFREFGEVQIQNAPEISESCLRDVCLIYSNTVCNGVFLRSLSYKDIPIITHVHELAGSIELWGDENFRYVKNQSSHYIACSKSVADMLTQAHNIPLSDLSIIPESICPQEIGRASQLLNPSKLRRALGINKKDFVVAGCGMADIRKGADLFIQLAEYCRNHVWGRRRVKFIWIGEILNDFSSGIFRQDVQKLGISDDIQFLGQLENPYPYLTASNLFCLPSREDPLPLVMLEAAALGKPVLAFAGSGGAEEFCRKGGGFLVPYLDVRAMGDWILNHLEDNATLKATAKQAQKLIQGEYNIEVTGPRYADLIGRLSRLRTDLAAGIARFFVLNGAGQAERELARQVEPDCWNRISFTFVSQGAEGNSTLRLDPLDKISVIEIAKLLLRSTKNRRTIWKAEKPDAFAEIQIEGSAVRLPDPQFLKLLSLGAHPILCTPPLALGTKKQEYKLEAVMRVDTRIDSVSHMCQPVINAYREHSALEGQLESLGKQVDRYRQLVEASLRTIEDLRIQQFWDRCALAGRDIYIWGTGSAGKQLAEAMIRSGRSFFGFVDRDAEKSGQQLFGRFIITPAALFRKSSAHPFIIIGSMYFRQIEKRLRHKGYMRGTDYAKSPLIE